MTFLWDSEGKNSSLPFANKSDFIQILGPVCGRRSPLSWIIKICIVIWSWRTKSVYAALNTTIKTCLIWKVTCETWLIASSVSSVSTSVYCGTPVECVSSSGVTLTIVVSNSIVIFISFSWSSSWSLLEAWSLLSVLLLIGWIASKLWLDVLWLYKLRLYKQWLCLLLM